MSTQTTNYHLTKPQLTDAPPDITVLNGNFDTIDAEMKRLSDKSNDDHDLFMALCDENAFVGAAFARANSNGIYNLLIDTFEDTDDIDSAKGNGAAAITAYWDSDKHIFDKQDSSTITIYTVFKVITAGANTRAWVMVDYESIDGGTIAVAFSRDNGLNWTTVTNNTLTTLSTSLPSGVLGTVRMTITGKVKLKNLAWGR